MNQDYEYNNYSNRPPKPNNWLVWAILTTLCCCLPFGIVGIVYATQVDSHYRAGRYMEAVSAAKNAKTWTLIGIACGVGAEVLTLVLYGAAIFASIAASGASYY